MAAPTGSPIAVAATAAVVVVGFFWFAGLEFPDNLRVIGWVGLGLLAVLVVMLVCAVIGGGSDANRGRPS